MMNVEDLFGMPGKDWPAGSDSALAEWLVRVRLDTDIRIAYGWTHIAYAGLPQQQDLALALAQDVVLLKYSEIVRRGYRTYDPTRHRGKQCPFRNWLTTIIVRAAVKASKREHERLIKLGGIAQPQTTPPPSAPDWDWEQLGQRGPIPPWVWERLWELGWIQPFVDNLPPTYRDATVLCDQEGLTRAEAAQRAGCTKGAMKVRLCRAHQTLRADPAFPALIQALIQTKGDLL